VNRWLNRFVSVALLAALAGCHSTPAQPARAPAPVVAAPTPAPPPTVAAPKGVSAPGSSGATPVASPAAGAPATVAAEIPIPPRAAQQYSQALELMKSGRNTDAELEFKQLIASYPQFAGPHLNLGLLYLRDSRLPEAEKAFKTALELAPTNPVAGDQLGIAERRLGKFAEAEAAYQRAIEADPNYAPAHLNLGVLYDLYMAQPAKALEQFERYMELAGDNKQVAGWVAELRKRVGAPPAAVKKEPA
jgi:tetratricopeptide (TPR) repeat protein